MTLGSNPDLWQFWIEHAIQGENFCLDSIPPSASAYMIAELWTGVQPHAPTPFIVVTPSIKIQEEQASDLEAWGIPILLFPETIRSIKNSIPDPEVEAQRLQCIHQIQKGFSGVILLTVEGLEDQIPDPLHQSNKQFLLKTGQNINPTLILENLEKAGYHREVQVLHRGDYGQRGCILDLFPKDADFPIRLEWDDEVIASIRHFDPHTQRSLQTIPEVELNLWGEEGSMIPLSQILPKKGNRFYLAQDAAFSGLRPPFDFFSHDFLHGNPSDWILMEQRRSQFLKQLRDWIDGEWEITIACNNEGEQKRLEELLRENGFIDTGIHYEIRPILRGFLWKEAHCILLTDAEIFGRYQTLRGIRKGNNVLKSTPRSMAVNYSQLELGDYVVHRQHGISLYHGLQQIPGEDHDVLVLEFAAGAKLFVPLEQAHLVTRYVGVGKHHPGLDTLGGSRWEKARATAQKSVFQYAEKLLTVQAERDTRSGHAFGPDTEWQIEFENAFLYDETPDQLKAIAESKRDMETAKPMDRLICGDVGFGKTEVAIRAIFKSVMEGKQAALLAPTTVLAQQHYQTLSQRYADYPIRVELLSRFKTQKEILKVIEGIKTGAVDVVVGTHRLISGDVLFKDLGLVVVDEEQRFGVKQKEKFKELFRLVDILTLSATPIPRTLYQALTGMRDMTTIETAPPLRHSVETIVCGYDERVIREAIQRELKRQGQIFFLHNRVKTIEQMKERLQLIAPDARIVIGHGQMDKSDLEEVMHAFVNGQADILLSTTIIESGIDIPNANTIIIDRADRFGLADLYQLRGRVGRSHHKAYAYLLLPRDWMGTGEAKKRVNAIKQYAELGAGFKIAMRDLEIRGAGNVLGTAQSGHITAIGFELYCQLLKTAVAQIKGEKKRLTIDCKLNLDFIILHEGALSPGKEPAYLTTAYMKETPWRIDGYRRLAELGSIEEWKALHEEWIDRFGPLPESAELLLKIQELKILAASREISQIQTQAGKIILKRNEDYVMVGGKFPRLTTLTALSKVRELKQWIESFAPLSY